MLPPSSFAREFRARVVPKLTAACELHGLFVALRLETPCQAQGEVMGLAWEHDCSHLPEEHFEHLEAWVMDTVLTYAAVKREKIEARDDAMAHVADDVEQWDRAVREAFIVA